MTNIKTKLISLALAACMLCAASISVSAAEINQSGGSGSTPVNLTTTNGGLNDDGTGGGTVTPTKLNVTVPTALPLEMSDWTGILKVQSPKTQKYGKIKSTKTGGESMKYTKEFKEEALKLSYEIGVRKTAEQLGLKYNTLTDWRKHRKEEETRPRPSEDEQARRIRELEQELAEVKRANDILKDALGFFAKDRKK